MTGRDVQSLCGPQRVVLMGVSGSGKTTLGIALAKIQGWTFVEGDHHHSPTNVAKMSSGQPLNDDDRVVWLLRLSGLLQQAHDNNHGLVMSCSALKRSYRDMLRGGDPGTLFVHLHGQSSVVASRMLERPGHYMPATLLESQFADLQIPQADELVLCLDIQATTEVQVQRVLEHLKRRQAQPS